MASSDTCRESEALVMRTPMPIAIVMTAAAMGIAGCLWYVWQISTLPQIVRIGALIYAAFAVAWGIGAFFFSIRADSECITRWMFCRKVVRWIDVGVYEVKPVRWLSGHSRRLLRDSQGKLLMDLDIILLSPNDRDKLVTLVDAKLSSVRREEN